MHFIWSTALKDLSRRRRDPLALVGWVGIPLVITLLLQLVFGGGQATPHGLLLVADQDGSFASSLLLGAFNQGKLSEMFAVEKVELEAGRARIHKGDGSALLIIPQGFGRALALNEPSQLKLLTNPAQRILRGIIEEALSIMLDAAFYLQTLFGKELRGFAQGPPPGARTFPDTIISAVSVQVNRLIDRLQTYLSPALIKLETTVKEESTGFNFAQAFFPAMLFMALLFTSQGMADDVWREHAQGALRRVLTTPARLEAFLAGKLLGIAMLVAFIGAAGLVFGRYVAGVKMSHMLPALLWVTFAGIVLSLMMMLLQMLASTARTGHMVSSIVLFPLAMLGGSLFPFELMPARLAAIGRFTPNGWAVVEFKAILGGSIDPAGLAKAFLGLTAFGAILFLLLVRRVRRLA